MILSIRRNDTCITRELMEGAPFYPLLPKRPPEGNTLFPYTDEIEYNLYDARQRDSTRVKSWDMGLVVVFEKGDRF
jgi:hypothetical protein